MMDRKEQRKSNAALKTCGIRTERTYWAGMMEYEDISRSCRVHRLNIKLE
jgi:hypothetical protein